MKALDIIHDEHRALGAVLQAFGFVLDGIRDGRFQPDFALLAALIEYITQVPDKLHHPKEDDYLFVKMRERIPAAASLLDQLEAEHADGARRTAALRGALVHYQGIGPAAFAEFEAAARTYLAASWSHVNREETALLPMARTGLPAEDWAEIDAAFAANKSPWSGPAGEFRALFSRIVNMVPSPMGVGAAGSARV